MSGCTDEDDDEAPITPRAPAHLQPKTRAWFRLVVASYELAPHHHRLLTLACQAWDRCEEARLLLAADGLVIEGREGGCRAHPAIAIERDSRSAFAALLKQLGLDDVGEPKRGPGRPGAVNTITRAYFANERSR